ncbi:Regulation of nuclear pre-mRNA domain-containing protein 1B [Nymphon striatum]|nr:Regulation of nuclear pre-mRNA domain-containing protein 1B [Nymphon striatum]
MSGFTESALEKKLIELNSSQQSIQTLSLWLIHHRKHYKTIIQVWYRELKRAKANKRLTFMYLANDIIQNSRKKGPEFTKEFSNVLEKAFYYVALNPDEKTQKRLHRLLDVWSDRGIYNDKHIKDFRTSVSNALKSSAQQPPKKKKEVKIKPQIAIEPTVLVSIKEELELGSPKTPPEPEVLIKVLEELENSASSDACVRELIANLPPEVSDLSVLENVTDSSKAKELDKKVDDALNILDGYNSRLTAELEDRKKSAQMLSDFIRAEREEIAKNEEQLEEYKGKFERVTKVRSDLKSHIQNLPDLTRLPDVTGGGLAPLPSAGDLFNIGSR